MHEPQSPQTVINMQQNINQTQNVFGGPEHASPAPFTPSRRMRSRTPVSQKRLQTTRQATMTSPEVKPVEDAVSNLTQQIPSLPHQGDTDRVPNTEARWLTPQDLPDLPPPQGLPAGSGEMPDPAPALQVVDLTGDNDNDGGHLQEIIPQTPPDLDEPLPVLPAKRPFDALKTDVMARKAGNSSLRALQLPEHFCTTFCTIEMLGKARPTCFTSPADHVHWPSYTYVKWRRTIDANSNEIIFEGVFDPEKEDEEHFNFDGPKNVITELWYSKPSRKNQVFRAYDDALDEIEPGWDGSDDVPLPPSKRYYQVYALELAKNVGDALSRPSDSDTEADDYKFGTKKLTRQEKKAIEKELHYRDILSQAEEYIEEFVKSAQKEEASFMEWKSLKPVPPQEAQEILRDPVRRKRVITSRACYRDKNKGVPPLKAKTRIVARGNQDPDLKSLTRQAATPSRISEMLTYLIFISGLRGKAFGSTRTWKMWAGTPQQLSFRGLKIFRRELESCI